MNPGWSLSNVSKFPLAGIRELRCALATCKDTGWRLKKQEDGKIVSSMQLSKSNAHVAHELRENIADFNCRAERMTATEEFRPAVWLGIGGCALPMGEPVFRAFFFISSHRPGSVFEPSPSNVEAL